MNVAASFLASTLIGDETAVARAAEERTSEDRTADCRQILGEPGVFFPEEFQGGWKFFDLFRARFDVGQQGVELFAPSFAEVRRRRGCGGGVICCWCVHFVLL